MTDNTATNFTDTQNKIIAVHIQDLKFQRKALGKLPYGAMNFGEGDTSDVDEELSPKRYKGIPIWVCD